MADGLSDREVMRWFRDLPGVEQGLVSVARRPRGFTSISPRRRVADGRNVSCRVCAGELVWFTNEGGDPARRRAQVAAARHLHRHLVSDALTPRAESAADGAAETAPR